MSRRNHSNWLEAYLDYTQYSESPAEIHFWTGVATIAGALRRHVWIDMGHFQWTPNFYITIVAPPGIIAKSTSINIGMNLLREIEGVHFGPQVITWQSLTQTLGEARQDFPFGKDDLGLEIYHPMSCLTCAVDELGTFLNPSDKEMVDALTSLWDSKLGVWDKKTKTQGSDEIKNPWLNIISCTTPSWMHNHFTEDLIGGGLASRTMFVYAEKKRNLIAYPARALNGRDQQGFAQSLIEDLQQIAEMVGPFELTQEAFLWGEEWYEEHYRVRPTHMASDRYGGYLARKQTHVHKTAMVISAAQSNDLVITLDQLQSAAKYVSALELSMNKVFSKVGESSTSKYVNIMSDYLRAYGEIPDGRLWMNCMNQMTGRDYKRALADGIEAGVFGIRQSSGERLLSLKGASK